MSHEFEYNFKKYYIKHLLIHDYLQSTGWEKIKENNGNYLYHYTFPESKPIPLIVPNPHATDFKWRVRDLIRTLEVIEKNLGENIIESINNVRKDVWKIRILKDSNVESLRVEQLEKIISYIKRIISYTASAEQDARPYYTKPLSTGLNYSKECRIGHTFRGSYGITIEAPIYDTITPEGTLPLGRRITERMIKSLELVEKEHEFGDVQSIYKDSINGNICTLLIELLKVSEGDIEYSAIFSPLYEPSPEIKNISTVHIKPSNITYLEEVYDKMHSDMELISNVAIQGVITELKHDFQESEDDSDYNVIISGTHDGSSDKHDYHLVLKKDDYIRACQIHTQSIEHKKETVEVIGDVRRTKKYWYIDSYTVFNEIMDVRAHNAVKNKFQGKLLDF